MEFRFGFLGGPDSCGIAFSTKTIHMSRILHVNSVCDSSAISWCDEGVSIPLPDTARSSIPALHLAAVELPIADCFA
jgi:hypothetical protein